MAVAQQQPLTPAELGAGLNVAGAGQTMIGDLAITGSGQYIQSVETFQILWNDYRDALNSIFVKLRYDVSWFHLEETGRYEKTTAGALGLVTGGARSGFKTLPPPRASGMTVWYAQNKDAVDAMAPINIAADEMPPINEPEVPPQMPGEYAADAVERATSGALVQDLVNSLGPDPEALPPIMTDLVCPPGTALPQGCRFDEDGFICRSGTSRESLVSAGCFVNGPEPGDAPVPGVILFDENGARIYASPTLGWAQALAYGFAVAVVTGSLIFFSRKERRRAT